MSGLPSCCCSLRGYSMAGEGTVRGQETPFSYILPRIFSFDNLYFCTTFRIFDGPSWIHRSWLWLEMENGRTEINLFSRKLEQNILLNLPLNMFSSELCWACFVVGENSLLPLLNNLQFLVFHHLYFLVQEGCWWSISLQRPILSRHESASWAKYNLLESPNKSMAERLPKRSPMSMPTSLTFQPSKRLLQ